MIICQPKEKIASFVAQLQGRNEPWGNYTALGQVRGNELVAGVVYNNFSGAGVCGHIAGKGNWLTRDFLYAMFDYPFNQVGVRRITVLTARKNKKARKFVEHLGFKHEGCVRHALPNDDWILYGMIRSECKYLVELRRAA